MSEPTDPIAQLIAKWRQEVLRNKPGLFYRAITRCADELDALRAQRTEGRPSSTPDAADPPWTLFMDLKLTGNHGGLIRDHHASRPVTDGDGFRAMYQRWQELTEAPIERTEGRPPADARVKEISERLLKITPGAWQKGTSGNCDVVSFNGEDVRPIASVGGLGGNRSFISNAPDDVRYLLEQVADLQSQIETLTASQEEHERDRVRLEEAVFQGASGGGLSNGPSCRGYARAG
jgi:hypothetical protein